MEGKPARERRFRRLADKSRLPISEEAKKTKLCSRTQSTKCKCLGQITKTSAAIRKHANSLEKFILFTRHENIFN
jgi:hypothetical protein